MTDGSPSRPSVLHRYRRPSLAFVLRSAITVAVTMRLAVATLALLLQASSCFIPHSRTSFCRNLPSLLTATPSKVVDQDGPTPEAPDDKPEIIDPESIPELHYDEDAHPIPHQPWRRGNMEGCEDPIEAPWRIQAEHLIKKSAGMVNGRVLDVTWYLTQVVITVDDVSLEGVDEYTMGPEIVLAPDDDGPEYIDPEDPNPEPIWADEEEFLYERDDETEDTLKRNMWVGGKTDGAPENPVKLFVKHETREDMAAMSDEEEARLGMEETPVDSDVFEINTPALSTMARAILEALETMEDELHVLERHEVILTSPGDEDLLETQSQFDEHEGSPVIVETQDPFGSNRVLKGTLLMRNSMDVIINKKGRMVTIPLNFVRAVRLPQGVSSSVPEEVEVE